MEAIAVGSMDANPSFPMPQSPERVTERGYSWRGPTQHQVPLRPHKTHSQNQRRPPRVVDQRGAQPSDNANRIGEPSETTGAVFRCVHAAHFALVHRLLQPLILSIRRSPVTNRSRPLRRLVLV